MITRPLRTPHESPAIDEEGKRLQLEPTDLVKIFLDLKSELARKNSLLKFLGTTAEDIASKREAVVNILSFFDSIVASTTELPSLDVNCLNCTSRKNRTILPCTAAGIVQLRSL